MISCTPNLKLAIDIQLATVKSPLEIYNNLKNNADYADEITKQNQPAFLNYLRQRFLGYVSDQASKDPNSNQLDLLLQKRLNKKATNGFLVVSNDYSEEIVKFDDINKALRFIDKQDLDVFENFFNNQNQTSETPKTKPETVNPTVAETSPKAHGKALADALEDAPEELVYINEFIDGDATLKEKAVFAQQLLLNKEKPKLVFDIVEENGKTLKVYSAASSFSPGFFEDVLMSSSRVLLHQVNSILNYEMLPRIGGFNFYSEDIVSFSSLAQNPAKLNEIINTQLEEFAKAADDFAKSKGFDSYSEFLKEKLSNNRDSLSAYHDELSIAYLTEEAKGTLTQSSGPTQEILAYSNYILGNYFGLLKDSKLFSEFKSYLNIKNVFDANEESIKNRSEKVLNRTEFSIKLDAKQREGFEEDLSPAEQASNLIKLIVNSVPYVEQRDANGLLKQPVHKIQSNITYGQVVLDLMHAIRKEVKTSSTSKDLISDVTIYKDETDQWLNIKRAVENLLNGYKLNDQQKNVLRSLHNVLFADAETQIQLKSGIVKSIYSLDKQINNVLSDLSKTKEYDYLMNVRAALLAMFKSDSIQLDWIEDFEHKLGSYDKSDQYREAALQRLESTLSKPEIQLVNGKPALAFTVEKVIDKKTTTYTVKRVGSTPITISFTDTGASLQIINDVNLAELFVATNLANPQTLNKQQHKDLFNALWNDPKDVITKDQRVAALYDLLELLRTNVPSTDFHSRVFSSITSKENNLREWKSNPHLEYVFDPATGSGNFKVKEKSKQEGITLKQIISSNNNLMMLGKFLGNFTSTIYPAQHKLVAMTVEGTTTSKVELYSVIKSYEEIIAQQNDYNDTPFRNDIFSDPNVRIIEDIRVHDGAKQNEEAQSHTSYSELTSLQSAINFGFYRDLLGTNKDGSSGRFTLYPLTGSDKSKEYSFIINSQDVFGSIAKKNGNPIKLSEPITKVKDKFIKQQRDYFTNLVNTILDDFRKVYPNEVFNNLDDIQTKLVSTPLKEVRDAFIRKGLDFVENIHYKETKSVTDTFKINKNLKDQFDIWSNPAKAETKVKTELENFAKYLASENFRFSRDISEHFVLGTEFNFGDTGATNPYFTDDATGKISVNPLAELFFYTHNLIATAFTNRLMGSAALFKGSDETTTFIERTKRLAAVISTLTPYDVDTPYGIPAETRLLLIHDPSDKLQTATKSDEDTDLFDGARMSSEIAVIRYKNSLGNDIGYKTGSIIKDVGLSHNLKYGTAAFMKHAKNAITHERMRNTIGASGMNDWNKVNRRLLQNEKFTFNMLEIFPQYKDLFEALYNAAKAVAENPTEKTISLFNTKIAETFQNPHLSNFITYYLNKNTGSIEQGFLFKNKLLEVAQSGIIRSLEEVFTYNDYYEIFNDLGGAFTVKLTTDFTDVSAYPYTSDLFGEPVKYAFTTMDSSHGHSSKLVVNLIGDAMRVNPEKAEEAYRSGTLELPMKSSIKSSNSNIYSVEEFEAFLEDDSISLKGMTYDNRRSGPQLNASKDVTGGKEASLPTQVVGAIVLGGKTFDDSSDAFRLLKVLAVKKLDKVFTRLLNNDQITPDQRLELAQKVQSVLQEGIVGRDITDVADAIINGTIDRFALDHAQVFKMLVATLNAHFTAEGIRQTVSGAQLVLAPPVKVFAERGVNGDILVPGYLYKGQDLELNLESGIESLIISNVLESGVTYEITKFNELSELVTITVKEDTLGDLRKALEGAQRVVRKNTLGRDLRAAEFFFYKDGKKYDIYDIDGVKKLRESSKLTTEEKNEAITQAEKDIDLIYKSAKNVVYDNNTGSYVGLDDKGNILWETVPGEILAPPMWAKQFGIPLGTNFKDITQEWFKNNNKDEDGNPISDEEASKIYQSYLTALNVVTARIPLQSLASVMSNRIVGFIHSEQNTAIVNNKHQKLTGGDFDIDKTNLLTYFVNKKTKQLYRILDPSEYENEDVETESLLNTLVSKFQKIALDPRNKLMAETAVDMDEIKDAAKAAGAGRMIYINENTPAAKFITKAENMTGKDTIGIAAVGIKILAAIHNAYHAELRELRNNYKGNIPKDDLIAFNQRYGFKQSQNGAFGFDIPYDNNGKLDYKTVYLPPNLDYNEEYNEKFVSELISGEIKNEADINAILTKLKNAGKAYDILGQLLNAATDNAKFLYLSKINANLQTGSIFTWLVNLGGDVKGISKFLTSREVMAVTKMAKRNILMDSVGDYKTMGDIAKDILNDPMDYLKLNEDDGKEITLNTLLRDLNIPTFITDTRNVHKATDVTNISGFEVNIINGLKQYLKLFKGYSLALLPDSPTKANIDYTIQSSRKTSINLDNDKAENFKKVLSDIKYSITDNKGKQIQISLLDSFSFKKTGDDDTEISYSRVRITDELIELLVNRTALKDKLYSSNVGRSTPSFLFSILDVNNWHDVNYALDSSEAKKHYKLLDAIRQTKERLIDYDLIADLLVDPKKDKQTLEKLVIYEGHVKEFKLLGKALGINQGLGSSDDEMFAFKMNFDKFITESWQESIQDKNQKFLPQNKFSLIDFILNEDYRNEWINRYDKIKKSFNILNIIAKNEHTLAQLKVYAMSYKTNTELSYKMKTIEAFFDILKRGKIIRIGTMDEKTLLKGYRAIETLLVDKYLSENTEPLEFKFNGQKYFYNFANAEDREQFVLDMNETFIKYMQKVNGDNEFIQSLMLDTTRPDLLKGKEEIYKLPIDGSSKSGDIFEIEEASMKKGISKLNKPGVAEMFKFKFNDTDSLATLFRFYSLLVHKDSMARENFIRYFDKETLLDKAGDFLKYVSDMGKMPQEEAINDLTQALLWINPKDPQSDKERFDVTKLADLLFESRLLKHKRHRDKKHKIQLTKVNSDPNNLLEQTYEVVVTLPRTNTEEDLYIYKPNSRKYFTIFGNRTKNRKLKPVSSYLSTADYEFMSSNTVTTYNDENRRELAKEILVDC